MNNQKLEEAFQKMIAQAKVTMGYVFLSDFSCNC